MVEFGLGFGCGFRFVIELILSTLVFGGLVIAVKVFMRVLLPAVLVTSNPVVMRSVSCELGQIGSFVCIGLRRVGSDVFERDYVLIRGFCLCFVVVDASKGPK